MQIILRPLRDVVVLLIETQPVLERQRTPLHKDVIIQGSSSIMQILDGISYIDLLPPVQGEAATVFFEALLHFVNGLLQ